MGVGVCQAVCNDSETVAVYYYTHTIHHFSSHANDARIDKGKFIMSVSPIELFAVAHVLLILLVVLLSSFLARSSPASVSSVEIDAGDSVTIQAGDPPEDTDKGGRYVLSGNFSGATIFLGTDAKDLDINTDPAGAEEGDSEDL